PALDDFDSNRPDGDPREPARRVGPRTGRARRGAARRARGARARPGDDPPPRAARARLPREPRPRPPHARVGPRPRRPGPRSRSLEATPDDVPAALFDLAELRAELLADGRATEAARIGAELERRVAAIDALDDLLRFEAAERYASLVTAQEDLALDREILLL